MLNLRLVRASYLVGQAFHPKVGDHRDAEEHCGKKNDVYDLDKTGTVERIAFFSHLCRQSDPYKYMTDDEHTAG